MKWCQFWILPVVLLCGCAAMKQLPGCVRIGPDGQVCPLPPSALPKIDASHIVAVTQNGKRRTFLGRLEIDADSLRLAGFSLFGTHIFTITYDGHEVASYPPHLKLDPKLIVVMLESVLADPAVLRPRLHGITLKITNTGHGEVREAFEKGKLVVRIETSKGPAAARRVKITLPRARLALDLKPLDSAG